MDTAREDDAPTRPAQEELSLADSEDATRTQIRGSSLLLAGRLLSLLVNLAVQVLIARYLSKRDYGAFAYALSFVTLGQSIVLLGLDRAITRFLPIYEERRDYARMFGTIVLAVVTAVSLGLSLVLVVVGFRGAIGGSLIADRHAVTVLSILIFLAPVQALDELLMGMFAVLSRPRSIFFRRYVAAPGLRLAVVLLLVLGGSDVSFLALGYVVTGAAGVAFYAVVLVRVLRERGLLQHFTVGTMRVPAREVLAFTVPLLTTDLVYAMTYWSDAVLLGHFRGAADVAAFRVIQPAARLNELVIASFALLFTPVAARLFARKDEEGINRLYWQTALWLAVLSFPVFALTFSLARPVTVTLYGDRYEQSAVFLALLSFGYYFQAALGFNGLTLKVFGKLRYIVSVNLLVVVINIGLNLLLIPRYGALGAAIGTTTTLVAFNVLKQAGLRLGTGITLFQWRHTRVYLAIGASALFLLGVQVLFSPPLAVGLPLAVLASGAVLAVGRRSLEVSATFPELRRFRLVRVLLGE